MTMARPRALVTGASSGIGEALAEELARHGHDLVLVARRAEPMQALAARLREAYGVEATVDPRDLLEREAATALAAAYGDSVDVLVNNAGFGLNGEFGTLSLERQTDMIELNVTALTRLSRLFLPGMLARGRGRILNVASTAAFQPGPFMSVYYATKAYVLSFSEALGEECRGRGVTVTALCPGPTKSGFQDEADLHGSRLLGRLPLMDVGTVARAGVAGMQRGQSIVIPGFMNSLMAFSVRFTPRAVVTRLSGYLTAKG